jgi:hypothetical protein
MSPDEQRKSSGGGFVHTIAKRLLAPLVATATAFLIRKGTELWQEKVQPKLEERGGPTAAAREALETVGEKLPEPVSEKLPTPESASTDETDRDEERRKREQRRAQRRRSLDKARSG